MREQGGPLRTAAPTRDAGPEVVGADVPIGPPYCMMEIYGTDMPPGKRGLILAWN